MDLTTRHTCSNFGQTSRLSDSPHLGDCPPSSHNTSLGGSGILIGSSSKSSSSEIENSAAAAADIAFVSGVEVSRGSEGGNSISSSSSKSYASDCRTSLWRPPGSLRSSCPLISLEHIARPKEQAAAMAVTAAIARCQSMAISKINSRSAGTDSGGSATTHAMSAPVEADGGLSAAAPASLRA
mmetsp:Transcript_22346/g.38155  ORF Transcript_22346/g.38155 Transcript_22346/m.38155 type:complete len:183 (-) Transcript_22346:1047-1595(-)